MYSEPLIICHRKNTIKQLINTPAKYGIEIDVRSYNNKIILNHNPIEKGETFISWIKKYNHKKIEKSENENRNFEKSLFSTTFWSKK